MITKIRATGETAVPAGADDWAVDRLDLEAYLRRIGLPRPSAPTVAALFAIHRAHAGTIAFENMDPLLGRTPALELDAIAAKLVESGRGGYCYEHNLLLAAALEQLGFTVQRLSARVRMGASQVSPPTHMLLRVVVPQSGAEYLADVGFGGFGPLEPLPFADGAGADQGGWEYALARNDENHWVLRHRRGPGWIDLYDFRLDPVYPADYRMANHYIATYPNSPFLKGLFISRLAPGRRLHLHGWHLTESSAAGGSERDVAPAELADLLSGPFGIRLADADLGALLRRLDAVAT